MRALDGATSARETNQRLGVNRGHFIGVEVYVLNRVVYSFPIAKRFIVEILPTEDGHAEFSVEPVGEALPIQIGVLVKSKENIMQDIRLESILDTIPVGKFRILLEKMEAPE
jgi:hypothetical protein